MAGLLLSKYTAFKSSAHLALKTSCTDAGNLLTQWAVLLHQQSRGLPSENAMEYVDVKPTLVHKIPELCAWCTPDEKKQFFFFR